MSVAMVSSLQAALPPILQAAARQRQGLLLDCYRLVTQRLIASVGPAGIVWRI
jgi:hypothetical protein